MRIWRTCFIRRRGIKIGSFIMKLVRSVEWRSAVMRDSINASISYSL